MTAKKTGISVMAGQTEPPGPVALKFQHLLARITFAARSEGGNATVHSISLRGWMSREITTAARNPVEQHGRGNRQRGERDFRNSSRKCGRVGRPATHSAIAHGRGETDCHLRYRCREGKDRFLHLACHHREHVGGGEPLPLLVHPHRRRLYRVRPPTVNAWSDAIGGNVTIDVTQ